VVNHRRKKFISEYLLCGNATDAAMKAGYSKKTAYSQGQRLLKNVEIMESINESQERLQEETEVKLKEVVNQIKVLAFRGESQAIKLKALDMLMKHLGGYADNFRLLAMLDEDKLEELAKKALQMEDR
jgi:phage terminase small subunit